MILSIQLLVFRLNEQRYGVSLTGVVRVINAVEITVLPHAPQFVLGVINVAGELMPVLNLRQRFGLPEKVVVPADQFLIVQTRARRVALAIDQAVGVIDLTSHEIVEAGGLVPGVEQVQGLIKRPDGLVLLHDLETILTIEEAQLLDNTLAEEVVHGT